MDPTTLVRCWIDVRKLYVEHEAYAVGCDIHKTAQLFDTVPEARKYVTRADSARPETISYMQRHGYPRVVSVEKWSASVEDGVAFMRQFEQIIVHPRCKHTAEELRTYSYKLDRLSGDILPDLVDKANHTIDAIRYALLHSTASTRPGCWSTTASSTKPCGPEGMAMPHSMYFVVPDQAEPTCAGRSASDATTPGHQHPASCPCHWATSQ